MGWPLLAFPTPVSDRLIGGPPVSKPTCSCTCWGALGQQRRGLVPPGGPPKSTKVSVTGFLFNCSIVQVLLLPAVSTNWAATELLVLFTN